METRSTSPFASNVLKNILGDEYIADPEFADDMGKLSTESFIVNMWFMILFIIFVILIVIIVDEDVTPSRS